MSTIDIDVRIELEAELNSAVASPQDQLGVTWNELSADFLPELSRAAGNQAFKHTYELRSMG